MEVTHAVQNEAVQYSTAWCIIINTDFQVVIHGI